uniref:Uncharacterized protein n=1 Tax=Meloidogyne incognita TaxID=6306 RepID=A0A914N721_MELIC
MNGTRTVARFPPEIWSVYYRTLDDDSRTNNFAESSHRRLQQAFSCTHPSIWKFIETLKREQKSRDADMAKCIAGEEPPKKTQLIKEIPINSIQTNIFISSQSLIFCEGLLTIIKWTSKLFFKYFVICNNA